MIGIRDFCREIKCPYKDNCDHDETTCISKLKEHISFCSDAHNVPLNEPPESDALLRILNKCIQRSTDRRTVGHYVVESGEMSRMQEGEEIHIISDEYINYDYTPVSSLAIALNTKKGVRYYYYGTRDQMSVIMALRERVKDYYQKTYRARNRIVCWIRQAKSSIYDYQEFLRSICGYSIGQIVRSLITGSNITEREKMIQVVLEELMETYGKYKDCKMPNLAGLKKVIDWLQGHSKSQDDYEVYSFIDNIGYLIVAIKDKDDLMHDVYIKDFCDKIQLLLDMKEFAIWQTKSDYDIKPERIENLFRVFQFRDNNAPDERFNELISQPMREWLSPQSDVEHPEKSEIHCGVVYCDEEEMNRWASNIHFCPLEDNHPYILCYSFTLFLGDEGPAAAWYTTYRNNANKDASAIDNDLFMIDFLRGDELLIELEDTFKTLILKSNDECINELRSSQSRILDNLGIT